MKRYPALIPYSRFHRSVLFLSLLCKKSGPSLRGYPETLPGKWNYALDFWNEQLLRHFEKEEWHIWSKLAGKHKSLDDFIELMRAQQLEIERAFTEMPALPVNEDALHDLGLKLEQHIRTKERKVFQHIQALYSEEELSALIE